MSGNLHFHSVVKQCSPTFQDPIYANILPIGQDGFLLVLQTGVDIYEWNGENETLVRTALTQEKAMDGSGVVAVATADLLC